MIIYFLLFRPSITIHLKTNRTNLATT